MVCRHLILAMGLLMGAGAGPLGAQDPDTVPARPEQQEGEDPSSEPRYVAPRFAVSMTVGTVGSATLQSQPVTARRLALAGAVLDSTTLTRSLESGRGYQVGLSGVLSLDPTWAVRLSGALGRTTIRSRYDGEPELFVIAAAELAEPRADVTLLAVETALRMRIPSSRRAQPFLEVGTSVVRWSASPAPIGDPAIGDGVRRVGGLAAVGVEIPYSARLSGLIQATTHFSRTPVDPVAAGTAGPASTSLSLTFEAPQASAFADRAHELTTTLRLEAGISLGLGGTVAGRPAPDAPAAPPSPPGH